MERTVIGQKQQPGRILVQTANREKAAIEAAAKPAMPLLGATVVAVMAFYPIMASDENAGEYCRSLFTVVAIALLLSWVLSVTIAPIMCLTLLSPAKKAEVDAGAPNFGGSFTVPVQFHPCHIHLASRVGGAGKLPLGPTRIAGNRPT